MCHNDNRMLQHLTVILLATQLMADSRSDKPALYGFCVSGYATQSMLGIESSALRASDRDVATAAATRGSYYGRDAEER